MTAFPPCSIMFSRGFFLRVVTSQDCVVKSKCKHCAVKSGTRSKRFNSCSPISEDLSYSLQQDWFLFTDLYFQHFENSSGKTAGGMGSSGKETQGSPQKFFKAWWHLVELSSWVVLKCYSKCYLTSYSLSLTSIFIYMINFVLIKKILLNLLLKEINGTSLPISISKQISIKMKNPESLRYYMFASNFFILFFFTFINEQYFNSSYYSYKVYHASLCKISFHL